MSDIRQEMDIEGKVILYAAKRGWRQRKMAFVGRKGCPDRWFKRVRGQLVIVEFKDPGGKLSPHQKREVAWLKTNGFNVHVIDSIQSGYALFDSLQEDEEEIA